MRYQGKIYRPWIEANSLLIQVTLGCSNNQCTFCTMFDDKRFKVRDIEEVFEDIDSARRQYPNVESIFLTDGNVMAARTDYILRVLDKLKASFPELKHISMYAGFNDLRRKTPANLKAIRQAGLNMVYTGLESGDPLVLERIKKRMTQEHIIEGALLAKDADIRMLQSFIFGLGGRNRSAEHIEETVRLLNITQPEAIAPMALAIQPGSELETEVQRGEFLLPTPLQIMQEEEYLLKHVDFPTYYWGDHGNNVSPMRGPLPEYQGAFLEKIQREIASNPLTKENILQTFSW